MFLLLLGASAVILACCALYAVWMWRVALAWMEDEDAD